MFIAARPDDGSSDGDMNYQRKHEAKVQASQISHHVSGSSEQVPPARISGTNDETSYCAFRLTTYLKGRHSDLPFLSHIFASKTTYSTLATSNRYLSTISHQSELPSTSNMPAITTRPQSQHSRLCPRRLASRSALTWQQLRVFIWPQRQTFQAQDYLTRQLPPEIRLLIYEYVLGTQFEEPVRMQRTSVFRGIRHKETALLAVNRLIHAEALPVFYRLNTTAIKRQVS